MGGYVVAEIEVIVTSPSKEGRYKVLVRLYGICQNRG